MNKKLLILIIIVCTLAGVFLALRVSYSPSPNATLSEAKAVVTPTPSVVTPLPVVGKPVRLIIPSLLVDVVVEEVGLDSEGRVDTPKDVQNTAWFKLGVRPGEAGSALIDGHLDTPTGAPSVFYHLKTLKKGDIVSTKDQKGKKLDFIVERVVTYPVDSIPMGEILEKTDEMRLNLITCGGEWDTTRKLYKERVVAYTKRESL